MSDVMVGIQLYTVREDLKKDFKGTLKALAAMGYSGVEFAGNYGDMSPKELAAFLHSLGLHAIGLHTSFDEILNPKSQSYTIARGLNASFLTTSPAGEVSKDWKAAVDRMAQAAATAYSQGFIFTCHNHAQELTLFDGVSALDMAMSRISLIQFELDTYWLTKGGQDPVSYIRKYAGRAPQIHLKDMDATDGSWAEVGKGTIDMKAVLAAATAGAARWLIVEQDACKRPPLESAKISIEAVRSLAGL